MQDICLGQAELASWRFDDTRFLGNVPALLCGNLSMWREYGHQASLATRPAQVSSFL